MKKRVRQVVARIESPFREFVTTQTGSSMLLLLAAAVALIWANSALASTYHSVWNFPLGFETETCAFRKPLFLWINDGLMAVFFFLVGLEIKRELLTGELSTPRKAALPIAAAIGGMLVPAIIYLLFNSGTEAASGWGIPMATDIAFSLGVLALVGKGIPISLKIFLTAFAIVDDLGAVMVIALFYTAEVSTVALVIAALAFAAMIGMNLMKIQRRSIFFGLSIVLWIALLKSGIHATIAGVLAAMTIPLRGGTEGEGKSMLESLEHALQPWVAYAIMPVFAIANAGVTVEGNIVDAFGHPVTVGIAAGLMVGKLFGLLGASWLAVRAGIATLPQHVTWRHITAVSFLGGIGFTMSLFIATLAFERQDLLAQAKIGILAGSLVAGILGWIALRMVRAAGHK